MKLLPSSGHTIQSWKNGGGVTAEIAVHPEGAGPHDFEWRISMASMTTDGPFSVFPGVARILAVIEGNGIALEAKSFGEKILTRNTAPFVFDGAEPVHCRLLGGAAADLNLMFRADRYRCAMQRLAITKDLRLPRATGTRFLVLTSGALSVAGAAAPLVLSPLDVLRDDGRNALNMSAVEPSVAFLLTIAADERAAGDQHETNR